MNGSGSVRRFRMNRQHGRSWRLTMNRIAGGGSTPSIQNTSLPFLNLPRFMEHPPRSELGMDRCSRET